MKNKFLICPRCEEFIGNSGLEECPVCGNNLLENVVVVEEDEEKEDED